jgi:predicted DNA-binding transcriptional regulator AlpA
MLKQLVEIKNVGAEVGEPITVYGVVAVAALLGVSHQTPMNWAKRGLFPPPLKIGNTRRLFWLKSDVEDFLEGKWQPKGKG